MLRGLDPQLDEVRPPRAAIVARRGLERRNPVTLGLRNGAATVKGLVARHGKMLAAVA